jgi:hypothetical protein
MDRWEDICQESKKIFGGDKYWAVMEGAIRNSGSTDLRDVPYVGRLAFEATWRGGLHGDTCATVEEWEEMEDSILYVQLTSAACLALKKLNNKRLEERN